MTRRKLPIGIQTFRKVREDGCYYVDKTVYVRRLVEEGAHYFLSRPRRFGKSLFLDTLKEAFEGNESLFEGLAIQTDWDWSVRHPVVRLSFGGGTFREPGLLHTNVMAQLDAVERETGVASDYSTAAERFRDLLGALHRRTGQRVVVLVDEYDKPILDALDLAEAWPAPTATSSGASTGSSRTATRTSGSRFSPASAGALSGGARGGTPRWEQPRRSACSPASPTSPTSPWSRTTRPSAATPTGISTRCSRRSSPGLDREAIRDWYNGYSWLGAERVYNPFDILLLFRRRKFDAYWFESGTPTFLVETLFERRVSSLALEDMVGGSDLLSTFDVDDMATEARCCSRPAT